MTNTVDQSIKRRKAARREEDATGQILRQAAAEITQGLLVVDADEIIVYLNPQYRALFGLSEDDTDVAEGVPLERALRTLAARGEYGTDTPEAHVTERLNAIRARSRFSVDRPMRAGGYMHTDGNPLDGGGYVFTFTDITERIEERKRLDKLVEAKTHELRQVNQKLLDGITYASLIQTGILPQPSFFETQIGENFIIYRPSDMVGGDFYLGLPTDYGIYVGLGDCTGHGIPGAMMTMMTASVCRRAISEVGPRGPVAVLEAVDQIVRSNLHQTEAQVGPDNGLELILILIQPDGLRMAAAGLDIFVQRNGIVERVRGDKRGLGYGRQVTSATNIQEIFFAANDVERIFLTSDGMLDQGGGEKGYGFGRRRLVEALQGGAILPIEDQGRNLEAALEAYSQGHLQRDDLTMLGFAPYKTTEA